MCDQDASAGRHLPPGIPEAGAPDGTRPVSLREAVASFEKGLIEHALEKTRGNRAKAARRLGSTERIVNYKIGKYGIDCDRFRR